jgi:hypothetical protein
MNTALTFLRGETPDNRGRFFSDMIAYSNAQLEESHDVIQWLFPLNEASAYNRNAPLLSVEDISVLKTDAVAKANILKAYERFLVFYEDAQWITPYNHNYLRLTRILKCLGLAGLDKEKNALKSALNALYLLHKDTIGETTKRFWDNA